MSTVEDRAEMAQRLKAWRARTGLSQRETARRLPTSRRNIEDWERGIAQPPDFLPRALRDIEREMAEVTST